MKTVTPGDPIRASHINDIVTSVRNLESLPGHNRKTKGTIPKYYDPFDLLYCIEGVPTEGEEESEVLFKAKIQPALYVNKAGEVVHVTFGGQDLREYPEVSIDPSKYNYYFNYSNGNIEQVDKAVDVKGLTKIWEFETDEQTYTNGYTSKLRWTNLIREHIDLSKYPTLHPFCWVNSDSDGSSIEVTLNNGCAFIEAAGIGDTSGSYFELDITKTIEDGKALFIKYILDENGLLVGDPEAVVELITNTGQDETLDPGHTVYYIKLLEYSERKITRFCSDSYITINQGKTEIFNYSTYTADLTSGDGTVNAVYESGRLYQFYLAGKLIYTEEISGAHSYPDPTYPDANNGFPNIPAGFWDNVQEKVIKTVKFNYPGLG